MKGRKSEGSEVGLVGGMRLKTARERRSRENQINLPWTRKVDGENQDEEKKRRKREKKKKD